MAMASSPNVSAKSYTGRTWRRQMRIEQVARLCATGSYNNTQIANHLGLSIAGLMQIKMTREFQSKMIEITTGVISDYDRDLREIAENSREELASMVPAALLTLRNSLLSKNPNIALKASLEIMDREGTNAKISKVNVTHIERPDLSKTNAMAFDILGMLARPVTELEGDTANVSNSFTVNAAEHAVQTRHMAETIDERTLEDLDLSKFPKQ